jgi:hypothetical protein
MQLACRDWRFRCPVLSRSIKSVSCLMLRTKRPFTDGITFQLVIVEPDWFELLHLSGSLQSVRRTIESGQLTCRGENLTQGELTGGPGAGTMTTLAKFTGSLSRRDR